MKKHLLYTYLAFFSGIHFSLFADNNNQSSNVVNTISQITETAKNVAGSVQKTTKKISTRTKEEAQYFAQEIRSLFRSPQQLILKQTPEDVAQEHDAIIIAATLDHADRSSWSSLVDLCNTESGNNRHDWYLLLEAIYLELRASLSTKNHLTLEPHFVPQLPLSDFIVSSLDDDQDNQSITITIVLQKPAKLSHWVELVQQNMKFIQDLSLTQDPYHQLDLFYTTVRQAIQKNLIKTICIETSN